MTEAQLQAMVTDLAKYCGYLVYHTYDSRRSAPGFPDLVLLNLNTGRLIFAELKSDRGRLRPDQKVWLEALSKRHDVFLWTPEHWTSGAIRSTLTRERAAA